MRTFPTNARELAKEIAAFASSQGGTILIGVEDDGSLVGLDDAETPSGRDVLLRRLEGICSGAVKPAITPEAKFGLESMKVVLAIIVPPGSQSVYYANHIPYIRHLTSSRHAEPHEVEERILSRNVVRGQGTQDADDTPAWVEQLIEAIFPVLVFGPEINERLINPWFDIWRATFKNSAHQIRDLVASGDIPEKHKSELVGLATLLDEVATLRVYIGSGPELTQKAAAALASARAVWDVAITPFLKNVNGSDAGGQRLLKAVNHLNDLGARADDLLFKGESSEFLGAVSQQGMEVLTAAIIFLRHQAPQLAEKLETIGHRLHLIETTRLYLDGGQSQGRVKAEVGRLRDELVELVGK